ncbi:hypothetical protein C4572_01440 [Candidatus Parcubacteria bacterium]|nr:MAG: hypothetical protein C4572_01440 [Candidatus Parcubacteria bacterium]
MVIKSELKQKILLGLLAGFCLGMSRSPRGYFKVLEATIDDWKNIKKERLLRIVKEFYTKRLVTYKEREDGTIEIVLTKEGEEKALLYKLNDMHVNIPEKWDGKWRMVTFDIPEKKKLAREALRIKLKKLGFREFQKSLFIFPYPCEDEINFIIEVFKIRRYVKFLTVDYFTNQEQFELKFGFY